LKLTQRRTLSRSLFYERKGKEMGRDFAKHQRRDAVTDKHSQLITEREAIVTVRRRIEVRKFSRAATHKQRLFE